MASAARKIEIVELEAHPISPDEPRGTSPLPAPHFKMPEILPITRALESPLESQPPRDLFMASLQGLITLQKEKRQQQLWHSLRLMSLRLLIAFVLAVGLSLAAVLLPWQTMMAPVLEKLRDWQILSG